jgi:hypothetical protein
MIPVLQFDPSSLTLWYDAHLIGMCRGRRELGLALEHAIVGDDPSLVDLLSCIDDEWVQTRAANIASTVWHEKRHFLDFVLTNYGALRIRHFFEAYANAGPILSLASESKRLLIPLDSNLDSITRQDAGVGEVDERVLEVARGIARRKQMMADDRRPVPGRLGPIDVGGEAIMEAIAYHLQHAKTHRLFGGAMNTRVQQDHPPGPVVEAKYKWAYELLIRSRWLKVYVEKEHEDGSQLMRMDEGPFLPLCYGALAGRFWKQKQVQEGYISSYLPAGRFASLIPDLQEHEPNFCDASTLEAWEIVNRACKRLFGRTVIEEIDADYECEARNVDLYERSFGDSHFAKAYTDLHRLRGRLIGELKQEPELFLNQAAWSDRMVNRTKPAIVVAAPSGEIGAPPPDYGQISAYRHPDTDYEKLPEARWWWAIMNKAWPSAEADPDAICVGDLESWHYIAAEYAPLAKLLYAGHKMRVMLGPELFGARVRFQEQTGVKLVLDPAFAWPETQHDAAYWYYITGRGEFRCDLSCETVAKPDGFVLDPWNLRLRPGLREALLNSLGDRRIMAFALWRDWSPWFLSEEYRDFCESFTADEGGFYDNL